MNLIKSYSVTIKGVMNLSYENQIFIYTCRCMDVGTHYINPRIRNVPFYTY